MAQAPIYYEGGGSGGSTGGSSTGGSTGGATGGGTTPAQSFSSAGAGTWDIPVQMVTAGVARNAPALELQSGEVVEVAPIPTNTQAVYISTIGPDAAKTGPRRALLATSNPVTLNVRNLCEIWIFGSVLGEGVNLTVRKR